MNESYLRGLYHDSTAEEREVAMQYYHQLQAATDGWSLCAADFTQRLHPDQPVRFFCLQVIEHHIRERHARADDQTTLKLRELLLSWMQEPFINGAAGDKGFVKNKMAQLYAMTCVIDYPSRWITFFSDLLSCISSGNLAAVDLYLRILLAIDVEVVDRDIVHTPEENQRNTLIKDTMREQCVASLVQSWYQIMVTFEQYDHEVTCLVMRVVGAYVSWIDITYIANEKFSSLLLKYLQVEALRESSCDCLAEIVSKGMDPMNKIELAESLTNTLKEMRILNVNSSTDEETDFLAKLSKLVNGIGMALVVSYNKLLKSDKERAVLALQAVENKIPYLVRYLNDEDDDVSMAVIPFAVGYVGVLKSLDDMTKAQSDMLKQLLLISINKMKYDEGYNFLTEGEDEVMFMEYRRELKVLFDNITQLSSELVLGTVHQLLVTTLSQLDSEPFMNVEVSLRFFYMMGEVLPDKGCHFSGPASSSSPWYLMMNAVVNSRLSYHTHIAVKIQYFELLVRYERYFAAKPNDISLVLEAFLDERGLRNHHSVVRSRVSYLFLRFIKPIKNQLTGIAEQVLKRIEDLLFTLPDSDQGAYLSSNDMLFMYEAAGILVVTSNTSPEQRCLLMNQLIRPALDKLVYYYPKMSETVDAAKLELYAMFLYHLMSYISRTTKVFPNHQTTRQSGCLECFAEALPVILKGLEVPVHKETLHSGVRQYLHRMIICLGDELLKYVPMAITLLLKDCQSQNIQEFIPLINQLIAKYKQRMGPFLQEVFMSIIHTILQCSSEPYDPRDEEATRDKQNLQKCYYQFISSLVNNNAVEVISSQGSSQLNEVLDSIVQGAMEFPDPSGQKICFGILKKLLECWGQSQSVAGFMDYVYKTIIPACFIVPMKSSFDLNDGHTFLALGEIAGILKILYQKHGDEFLQFLNTTYLPSINLSQDLTQLLLQAVQQADCKVLKNYLKVFFTQLRTISQ